MSRCRTAGIGSHSNMHDVHRVYLSSTKRRVHHEALTYLADLIDVIDPVIEIVHPHMQLGVVTFASAMPL